MRSVIPTLLIATVLISGCSTRANPVNWFNNNPPEEDNLTLIEEDNPLIPNESGLFSRDPEDLAYKGSTVSAIENVTLERIPGGVMIRATGKLSTQGAFNARLSPVDPDEEPQDGVLTYRLQAETTQVTGGAPITRTVIVGRVRTYQELGDTRVIRIEGLQNAIERRL